MRATKTTEKPFSLSCSLKRAALPPNRAEMKSWAMSRAMRNAAILPNSKPVQRARLPINGPKRMPDMTIKIMVGGMIVTVFKAMSKIKTIIAQGPKLWMKSRTDAAFQFGSQPCRQARSSKITASKRVIGIKYLRPIFILASLSQSLY